MSETTQSFWDTLARPMFVMAPLSDVTDPAFRRMIAKYSRHGEPEGGPDVFYTEFIAADGLVRPEAREKLLPDLAYTENERPIVAQIFSGIPEHMKEAARLMRERGFDGVDINMGCPDRAVEKQGAGCGLIKEPERAQEIIRATKEGAHPLPVSVKTRLGYNKNEMETWVPTLLAEKPAALTMHLRTRKEMSEVPAHWELMPEVVRMAHDAGVPAIGNGDVHDLADGSQKASDTGADGIMFGRAIFGNPWLFDERVQWEDIPLGERLRVMVEHTKCFADVCAHKNFAVMKKHYKAYVSGFDGAKELRMRLMDAADGDEVERIVNAYCTQHDLREYFRT